MRPTRIGMQGPDLWFLLMCPNARIVRQVWLDPKLFGAPIAEAFEERDQGLAGGAERIGDLRRRGARCRSVMTPSFSNSRSWAVRTFSLTPRRRLRSSANRNGPKEMRQTAWTFHLPLSTLMVA